MLFCFEKQNGIVELILFIHELKKRNFLFNLHFEKIEKAIEYKNAVCAQLEHHPRLPYGRKGMKCEEGLNEVKNLLNW